MAALFTAFDMPNYQKLIPQHIVDMLTIPKSILSNLSHGGFTVSISVMEGMTLSRLRHSRESLKELDLRTEKWRRSGEVVIPMHVSRRNLWVCLKLEPIEFS